MVVIIHYRSVCFYFMANKEENLVRKDNYIMLLTIDVLVSE